MAEPPLFPALEHDPNQQAGFDSMGNPVNGWGLPLGQRPSFDNSGNRLGESPTGTTNGYYGPGEAGQGNADVGFGGMFMGANPFRPGQMMVTSPGMSAATMTAAQMQAAGMNTAQADADRESALVARDRQDTLGNALMERALGQGGPSVAELQMQRGIGQAQQAAARQAASARGISRGLASYGAMNAMQNMASQGVQDAAALRAQEQMAAQGLASKHFGDQRMADLTSRGMSIQQAQAIMDAENRAREVNVGAENAARGANQAAVNDARKTSLQAGLSAAQGNQQADTAQQGMLTQITEGEAARGQKAIGGGIPVVGGLLGSISDINAKQDVKPLLYSQPMGLNVPEAPSREEVVDANRNLKEARKDTKLEAALRNIGNSAGMYGSGSLGDNPQRIPQYTPPPGLGEAEDPYGYTYQPPPSSGDQGGGGLDLGKIGGAIAMFSDRRTKNVAFADGLKAALELQTAPPVAGVMQKSHPASLPVLDLTPGRIHRMTGATYDQAQREGRDKVALAEALKALSDARASAPAIGRKYESEVGRVMAAPVPPVAGDPGPPAGVPLAQAASSDRRGKYTYSDERAKQAVYNQGKMDAAAQIGGAPMPQPMQTRMAGSGMLGGIGGLVGGGPPRGAIPALGTAGATMPGLAAPPRRPAGGIANTTGMGPGPGAGGPFGGGLMGGGWPPTGGGAPGGQGGGLAGIGGIMGGLGGGGGRPMPSGGMPALGVPGAPPKPGGMGGILGGMGGMISDRRAKDLEDENRILGDAVLAMGNAKSAEIRGEDPKLGEALTRMGRDADVSRIPTAAYPDIDANTARNANPPPGYTYSYKPEFAAKQGTDTEPRLGIMAQDALKSPMYRPAVVKMPDGMLGIDQNRLLHANTAMLSGEHKRLDEAEERDRILAEALARMGNQKSQEMRDF